MTSDANKFLSLLISSTLDNFGFSQSAISLRSKLWERIADSVSKNFYFHVFVVGSSGEGVGHVDSDIDFMLCPVVTICLDNAEFCRNLDVLETDYNDTPPGYTKLLGSHLSDDSEVGVLLSESDMYQSARRVPYISSAVFRNMFLQAHSHMLGFYHDVNYESIETNGPAITSQATLRSGDIKVPSNDIVVSLLYYGKTKRLWSTRCNGWPSNDILNEISQMEGYIVPVGMKESENVNIEWRVCYTTAEKRLVASLSDVQIKLYIVLKMIAKQIKQNCQPFTSYIVKNVVFWVVEGSSSNEFSPELLLHLTEKSMRFIKFCLQNNHLPNYMIPERNHLNAFNKQEKMFLLKCVTRCIEQSPGAFLLHTNLQLKTCISYMYTIPRFVVLYGQWRDQVEKNQNEMGKLLFTNFDITQFVKCTAVTDIIQNCTKNPMYRGLLIELMQSIVPDWCFLLLSGKYDEIWRLFEKRTKFLKML